MEPIFFTVKNRLDLMIIPDSEVHLDGQAAIISRYSIYYNKYQNGDLVAEKENKLYQEKKNNPDYMGTIVFELPGDSLSYISDGPKRLSIFEIQELVEKIINYRNKPWL